ncbi:MAG: hypothetical protein BWK76_14235 [Desulfobulbaceae bacterium A2]|nr:MAG: hypothetical protein BWK76_14235 [Desulfobulbaceae bacterium A2]
MARSSAQGELGPISRLTAAGRQSTMDANSGDSQTRSSQEWAFNVAFMAYLYHSLALFVMPIRRNSQISPVWPTASPPRRFAHFLLASRGKKGLLFSA